MTNHEPVMAPVYPSIGIEELGRLLRQSGFELAPISGTGRPGYRALTKPRFTVELTTPFSPRPGEFGIIHLWTRIAVPPAVLAEALAKMRVRSTFAFLFADQRGNLVVSHQIVVIGGVTKHYLRDQFWYWRKNLEAIEAMVQSRLAASVGRTLH